MTEDMRDDVMELLRAMDLPFLVAPFEAEAQCARLEEVAAAPMCLHLHFE